MYSRLLCWSLGDGVGSIILLTGLVLTWVLFRVLAGRATLGLSTFVLIFALGAASSVIGIALDRLAYIAFDLDTVGRLLAAPIDEICKALPLLTVVTQFRTWRRLTISDYALVGLAGGLGYEFVNWDFATLSGLKPQAWYLPVFGSLFVASEWEHAPVYFTGAVTTAFAGLAAGICVRLNPRKRTVNLVVLVAIALAVFENGMYRWQVGPLLWAGIPAHLAPVLAPIRILHDLMLDGRLELWLVVAGLLAGNWLEARWVRFTAPDGDDNFLLDEDATVALVPVEMLIAIRRLMFGWRAFAAIRRYFRDRRDYLLIQAEARRSPSDAVLSQWAAQLKRSLTERYDFINNPPSKGTRPAWQTIVKSMGPWIDARRYFVLAAALFLIYAIVPPNAWGGIKLILFGDWTALALIAASVALLTLRWLKMDLAGDQTNAAMPSFETALGVVVAHAATALAVFAAAAWFLGFETLVPHYGGSVLTPLEPFEIWSAGGGYPYGGNPHTFFAVAAVILACCAVRRTSSRPAATPVADMALEPTISAANIAERA